MTKQDYASQGIKTLGGYTRTAKQFNKTRQNIYKWTKIGVPTKIAPEFAKLTGFTVEQLLYGDDL